MREGKLDWCREKKKRKSEIRDLDFENLFLLFSQTIIKFYTSNQMYEKRKKDQGYILNYTEVTTYIDSNDMFINPWVHVL